MEPVPAPPYLFDVSPEDLVPVARPTPPARERQPRRRRRQSARLFSVRRTRVPAGPADRWRWRDGETLAQYVARTDDRRVRREDLPKDVRRVKGGAYQARPWIGPGRAMNVNLGLFHPEDFDNDRDAAASAAGRAAREFKKRLAVRGADIWGVIKQLQRETRFGYPVVPPHVLPPKVVRVAGGFGVRGRAGEVFETAEAAWAVAKGLFAASADQSAQNTTRE